MGWIVSLLVAIARPLVSRAVLRRAVEVARNAAVMFAENKDRRDWVMKELMKLGLSESIARLAVELAVQELKA